MDHIQKTHFLLSKALYGAKNPVLWISGGKDSLTLAHLSRAWNRTLSLLTVASDDGWPGELENLQACAEMWGYRLHILDVGIPFREYVKTYGWPVDVVPTAYDTAPLHTPSPYATPGGLRLSSGPLCQYVRFSVPLARGTLCLESSVVLTGSRAEDGPLFATQGEMTSEGVPWTRHNPMIHWTKDQVYDYVKDNGIPLPPHYEWKEGLGYDSPDCLSCTWIPEHWETLKKHMPEEYEKRWPEVAEIYREYKEALRLEYERTCKISG